MSTNLLRHRWWIVMTEVNGEALDSIDKAFALFTKLRHATNLEVTVRRKGQLVRKQVQIS